MVLRVKLLIGNDVTDVTDFPSANIIVMAWNVFGDFPAWIGYIIPNCIPIGRRYLKGDSVSAVIPLTEGRTQTIVV
jgi:hypothetical protein